MSLTNVLANVVSPDEVDEPYIPSDYVIFLTIVNVKYSQKSNNAERK